MLYMIVQTHNAESCAFRSESDGTAMERSFDRLDEVAARYEVRVEGAWINRPAHEFFLLVEAANGHVIDDMLVETGFVGRTHSRVLSVVRPPDIDVVHDAAHASATA